MSVYIQTETIHIKYSVIEQTSYNIKLNFITPYIFSDEIANYMPLFIKFKNRRIQFPFDIDIIQQVAKQAGVFLKCMVK